MVARLSIACLGLTAMMLPRIACAKYAGRVVSLRGQVQCWQSGRGQEAAEALTRGQRIHDGALIRTGGHASVRIVMSDKSILALGSNTELRVQSYGVQRQKKTFTAKVRLSLGRIWARVSEWVGDGERTFEVETSNAVAGVRGTEFVVTIDPSGATSVWVVEGEVTIGNAEVDMPATERLQVVSRNQHARVGNDGQVQVEDVTADQVKEQVGSVGPSGKSADDTESSSQPGQKSSSGSGQAGEGPGSGEETSDDNTQDDAEEGTTETDEEAAGDRDETAEEVEPLGGAETDEGIPPVELDPGSGNARVRGRVEVRD